MKIGMKIGAGFCAMLVLTIILGGISLYSMLLGSDSAEEIADDRMPRFIEWGHTQNDLLESAYYARAFFEGGDEKNMERSRALLQNIGKRLDAITRINSIIHYDTTSKKLELTKKNLAGYQKIIAQNHNLYTSLETMHGLLRKESLETLAQLQKLNGILAGSLSDSLDSGGVGNARRCAAGMRQINDLYAKMSLLFQDLLVAARRNKLDEFSGLMSGVPDLSNALSSLAQLPLNDAGRRCFEAAIKEFGDFDHTADQTAKMLADFAAVSANRFKLFREMHNDTIGMVKLTTDNSIKFVKRAVATLNSSIMAVSIILCVMILLGIFISVFITRLIVKPLAATQRYAQEVASGDLDKQLSVRGSDETGMLAESLRSMVSALKKYISDAHQQAEQAQMATAESVKATSLAKEAAARAENAKREGMLAAAARLDKIAEIISSAATQLTAQIEQSNHGASDSAARLQEAATAMNEMNATVQEVARNAAQAAHESADTKDKAEAGRQIVMQAVRSIGQVQETSLSLKSDMVQLNENAQDINRIMGVISDIADQTNLLALNAAIEAARAGEAGRGFAVVADEVRKLAEKTMSSTHDVSNAIKAIQDSTAKSMRAMDSAVEKIGEATDLANQSGEALHEIVTTVEITSNDVRAIATASEEQSAASEEINNSIIQVNEMSKMTAEAMSGATIAVSNLAAEANKMAELITEMKNG